MANIYQNVETYQKAKLAYLQNLNCFLATSNKKFKGFQNLTGNLGTTVTFDLPPRFRTDNSLVITPADSEQRKHTLTVDEKGSTNFQYNTEEEIFNLTPSEYMEIFGKSAMEELSATIESSIARKNIIGHTYRHFGNGVAAINSYKQLADSLALFRNYGAAKGNLKYYLDDIAVPAIVGTGQGQFVPRRNDADAMSWEVGNWLGVDYYSSNLLPKFQAGVIGDSAVTMTIDSVNAAGTQLTLSGGPATQAGAFLAGDLLTIGKAQKIKFLTFVGHVPSQNDVQVRVVADAATDGSGIVTVEVFPALIFDATNKNPNANIDTDINVAATFTVTTLPSHRAGLICGGNAMYLGMPKMPNKSPYESSSMTDMDTGASVRMYHGATLLTDQKIHVDDAVWGSTMVDEYAMRVIFPL